MMMKCRRSQMIHRTTISQDLAVVLLLSICLLLIGHLPVPFPVIVVVRGQPTGPSLDDHYPWIEKGSDTVVVRFKDRGVELKKKIAIVGDRMKGKMDVQLQDLVEDMADKLGKYEMKSADEARIQNMLLNHRTLVGRNPEDMKVQYVRGLDDGRHYAVGLVGNGLVIPKFAADDKLGVENDVGLARMLDGVHRDAWRFVAKSTGQRVPEQEYIGTDGHKVLGFTVGRTRDRRDRGFISRTLQGDYEDLEPLVERKKATNLYVTGFEPKHMHRQLEGTYGSMAGRAWRTEDQLKEDFNHVFALQSRYLHHPNAVSASWDGYIIDPDAPWPKKIGHEDAEEVEMIKNLPYIPTEDVVHNLVAQDIWSDRLNKHAKMRRYRDRAIQRLRTEAEDAAQYHTAESGASSSSSSGSRRRGSNSRSPTRAYGEEGAAGPGTSASSSRARNPQPPDVPQRGDQRGRSRSRQRERTRSPSRSSGRAAGGSSSSSSSGLWPNFQERRSKSRRRSPSPARRRSSSRSPSPLWPRFGGGG